jgi:hypothetical protein
MTIYLFISNFWENYFWHKMKEKQQPAGTSLCLSDLVPLTYRFPKPEHPIESV